MNASCVLSLLQNQYILMQYLIEIVWFLFILVVPLTHSVDSK